MVILALDVGDKRIGLATSDELEMLATPHSVVVRSSNERALEQIARVAASVEAGRLVVGLPVSFDGQLHAQARSVQAFAAKLGRRLALPVEFADESLSTVRAEEALRAAGVRPQRIRERIDAVAAAVILQDYLDHRNRLPGMGEGETI